jgi:anti-sigma B factor antagonist
MLISGIMAIHTTHPPIEVFKEIGPDSYILYLSGELDASNSLVVDEALRKALLARKPNVVVDFEHLHYISSTGLGVFLSHYSGFSEKKVNLVLVNMSEKIRSVFRLLGLETVIPIHDMPNLSSLRNKKSA